MNEYDIEKIGDSIEEKSLFINDIKQSIHDVIIGQDFVLHNLFYIVRNNLPYHNLNFHKEG